MKSLTLTVFVTCFNRESSILRALNSLSAQTDMNFNIIIVDDASTDNSVNIIEKFIQSNPSLRVQLYKQRQNLGQNSAINKAFYESDSELIAFLDSDDIWKENFVEEMKNPFQLSHIGFAYCRLVNGPKWELEGEDIFRAVLKQGFLSSLGTLVARRSALESIIPLPERFFVNDMCQDDHISFELSRRYSCKLVPMELYQIIGTENSITRDRYYLALGWFQLFTFYKKDILSIDDKDAIQMYYTKCLTLSLRAKSPNLFRQIFSDAQKTVGLIRAILYVNISILKITQRAFV
jgi:glycosyltransferase involved in cell wall biosynthesis